MIKLSINGILFNKEHIFIEKGILNPVIHQYI